MTSRPAHCILIGFLLAICMYPSSVFAQSGSASSTQSGIERTLQNCQHDISGWRRDAAVEITLAILIIVLGGSVSLLQKSDEKWAKRATVGLGVAISILTGVNSRLFLADDRTLRRAAFDGGSVLNELLVISDEMKDDHLTADNRAALSASYLKKLAEFHAIGEKLNGTQPTATAPESATASLFSLPRVYAESSSAAPSWVRNPPSNDVSFFFVGIASDPSLAKAQKASLDDALSNAVQALRPKAPNASDGGLLSIIKGSSLVQDTSFSYNKRSATYTYYTLLRLSRDIENIGLQSLPSAMTAQSAPAKFEGKNWRPTDLASNTSSNIFTLSNDGGVFRLVQKRQGSQDVEKLFTIGPAYSPYALTATSDAVLVAASSKLGCTVFRYSFATRKKDQRLVDPGQRCVGIATDGTALYLTFPDQKEIKYLKSWDGSVQTWSLGGADDPGYIIYDELGHRLIVADASGKAYSVSTADGTKQLLASNLGSVSSMAISRFHIVVASGTKILFLARSDGHGENPPAGLQSLTGGIISGVAVDGSDSLWFADYDKKLVEGPFPLS